MASERSWWFYFEAKLITWSRLKDDAKRVFEDLADYRSNCDAPAIVKISFITPMVFHDGNDSTELKLMRHKSMHQHLIEEALESLEDGQWSKEEMFCMYERIIACRAFLQTINDFNDVFKWNPMGGARTINMTSDGFTIFLVKFGGYRSARCWSLGWETLTKWVLKEAAIPSVEVMPSTTICKSEWFLLYSRFHHFQKSVVLFEANELWHVDIE